MIYLSAAALTLLLVGIFTSVSLIGVGQILLVIPLGRAIFNTYKTRSWKLPPSSYWLLAFIAIAILSLVINADEVPRMSRNIKKLKYPLFGILCIYFFRYWLPTSQDIVKKWVLNIFLTSVIVAAIFGITTFYLQDLSRINGFTDTMRYGYGSAMFLSSLLGALFYLKNDTPWMNKQLASAAFILGLIAMTLTFTRGAMLGFLVALPFIFYFYNKKLGIVFTAISLIFGLSMGGYYLLGKSNDTGTRFLITKENTSDDKRRSVWDTAVIAIKEKPIIGWGYSNFHSQMKRIKTENNLERQDYNDTHAHNVFLEIGAGTGFIGLFFFLGWVISWAWESFKTSWGRSIIVPFGVVFVVASQFEVTLDANTSTLIFLTYALSSALYKPKGTPYF